MFTTVVIEEVEYPACKCQNVQKTIRPNPYLEYLDGIIELVYICEDCADDLYYST